MTSLFTAAAVGLGLAVAATFSDMPPLIDQVLAEAEATPRAKFSYSMTFQYKDEPAVAARYDATADSWTTLSGDPDRLSRPAQEKFGNMQRSESKPGGLLYADFRDHLRQVTAVSQTPDEAVFTFVPKQADEEETGAGEDAPVRTRLVVDKESRHLALFEIRALTEFKPNPIAKLDEFVVTQEFERLSGDGPAVLTRLVSVQKGKRLMSRIDTAFVATFSDHQPVD